VQSQKVVFSSTLRLYYQLIDKAEILLGQTFSNDMESPIFEIISEKINQIIEMNYLKISMECGD